MQDSIRTYQGGTWATVDGIVEPVAGTEIAVPRVEVTRNETPRVNLAPKVKREYNIPPLLMRRYDVPRLLARPVPAESTLTVTDSLGAGDSLAANDTLSAAEKARMQEIADSIERELAGERLIPIVIENPAMTVPEAPVSSPAKGDGMSWIYLVLAILFCAVGLRFKNSSRHIRQMAADLTDVRIRHNVFDDTVRETSFKVLLNLLWVASAGVLLWVSLPYVIGSPSPGDSFLKVPSASRGIGVCMGIAGAYLCLLLTAYWITGNIFTDRRHTSLWVRGATAGSALETFVFFPAALLTLFYPEHAGILLLIAGAVFIVGKIIFIFKGFRIFFTQLSSLLLFLYYLCSLEIVPIILVYLGASVATSLV